MSRKSDQKRWKCDSYHETVILKESRNPEVDRLGEKTWYDSKEGNELGIVWRAHIYLEVKRVNAIFERHLVLLRSTKQLLLKKVLSQSRLPKSMTKRQIKGTFCVNISGELSPIQQI